MLINHPLLDMLVDPKEPVNRNPEPGTDLNYGSQVTDTVNGPSPWPWIAGLGLLAVALLWSPGESEQEPEKLPLTENPKKPEEYEKLFNIFKKLRKEGFEFVFPDSDWVLDDNFNFIKTQIAAEPRNDILDFHFKILRHHRLSQFFNKLSMVWTDARRKMTDEEYRNHTEKDLSNPVLSEAHNIWKKFFVATNRHADINLPPVADKAGLFTNFYRELWKNNLAVEIFFGEGAFSNQIHEASRWLEGFHHYHSLLKNNQRFKQIASTIPWIAEKPDDTFEKLGEKEQEIISAEKAIAMTGEEKVFLDMGDWKWVAVDCKEEADLMGHCGREYDQMIMLSLRHFDKKKKTVTAHVSAAFYYITPHTGFLTQIKGKGNNKPIPKYHDYIYELYKDPRIVCQLPGAYKPDHDMHLDDLAAYQEKELKALKPYMFSFIDLFTKIGVGGFQAILRETDQDGSLFRDARLENDQIILKSWDDEESFINESQDFLPDKTWHKIKSFYSWINDDPHDYSAGFDDLNKNYSDDLVEKLKKEKPEYYNELITKAQELSPAVTEINADLLDEIASRQIEIDDETNFFEQLKDAFENALRDGEEVGFRNAGHKLWLDTLDGFAFENGTFFVVRRKPFQIQLHLGLSESLNESLTGTGYGLQDFYSFDMIPEREFSTGDVYGDFDLDAAFERLVDMLYENKLITRKEKNPENGNKYEIPKKLFDDYVEIIYTLQKALKFPSVFKELDLERVSLHNKILEAVGTDRNDKEFFMWLEEKTTDALEKMEKKTGNPKAISIKIQNEIDEYGPKAKSLKEIREKFHVSKSWLWTYFGRQSWYKSLSAPQSKEQKFLSKLPEKINPEVKDGHKNLSPLDTIGNSSLHYLDEKLKESGKSKRRKPNKHAFKGRNRGTRKASAGSKKGKPGRKSKRA